jgi:hypothetical protein
MQTDFPESLHYAARGINHLSNHGVASSSQEFSFRTTMLHLKIASRGTILRVDVLTLRVDVGSKGTTTVIILSDFSSPFSFLLFSEFRNGISPEGADLICSPNAKYIGHEFGAQGPEGCFIDLPLS